MPAPRGGGPRDPPGEGAQGCWVARWEGAVVRGEPTHSSGEIVRLPYGCRVEVDARRGDFGRLRAPAYLSGLWVTETRESDGVPVVSPRLPRRYAADCQASAQHAQTQFYGVVLHPQGALVRKSEVPREAAADVLGTLPPGTAIDVAAVRGRRAFITSPLCGWLSMSTLSGEEVCEVQRFQPEAGPPVEPADRLAAGRGPRAITWEAAPAGCAWPPGWLRCTEGWVKERRVSARGREGRVRVESRVYSAPHRMARELRVLPKGSTVQLERAAESPPPAPVLPPAPATAFGGQQLVVRRPANGRYGLSLSGVHVAGVAPGGPAELAGLRPGMCLRSVDGHALSGHEDTATVRGLFTSATASSFPVTATSEGPPQHRSPQAAAADHVELPYPTPEVKEGSGAGPGPDSPLSLSNSAGSPPTSPQQHSAPPYAIGARVEVYYPADAGAAPGWYAGYVVGCDRRRQGYEVVFDSGEKATNVVCSSIRPSTRPTALPDTWQHGSFVLT
eukprot:TRINITY_DN11529_c0_g1_i2.p1 TRINITY_DN11529_c0_g1~~TRINITY_DN11529_c0_g1_i2.p1  ORF type:complete len:528 (+),score=149.62 TRINITY_DN11529_c0_g1_i2:77-1585(+)